MIGECHCQFRAGFCAIYFLHLAKCRLKALHEDFAPLAKQIPHSPDMARAK